MVNHCLCKNECCALSFLSLHFHSSLCQGGSHSKIPTPSHHSITQLCCPRQSPNSLLTNGKIQSICFGIWNAKIRGQTKSYVCALCREGNLLLEQFSREPWSSGKPGGSYQVSPAQMLCFRKEKSMYRALALSIWVLASSALPTVQTVRMYFFFQTSVTSPVSLSHRIPLSISELLNYCILYFHTAWHLSWSRLLKLSRYYPKCSLDQFILR